MTEHSYPHRQRLAPWLRSALAVVAGVVTASLLVLLLTMAAVFLFFEGDFDAPPTPLYLAANVVYSALAGVAGGWLAATVARRRPLAHAIGVAGVMAAPTMIGIVAGPEGTAAPGIPPWYGALLPVLGPVGAVLGGVLRARRTSLSSGPADAPTTRSTP